MASQTHQPTYRNSRGQGMTEYIIIVALIAIAAIATYNLFGKTLRNQTAAIASGLAGQQHTADQAMRSAKDHAGGAQNAADTNKGLDNFATHVGQK